MGLQKNYTTPEQSKRLLELGVPADSSDLFYDNEWLEIDKDDVPIVIHKTHKFTDYDQQEYAPCWSFGRLIELYMKAKGLDFMYFRIMSDADIIDSIVRMFVENQNEIDFSKLEE